MNDIERAFINSGLVSVVASSNERGSLRDEKDDQSMFATPESTKQMGRELGADYMLMGQINTIEDREGGKQVTFYQVDLTLTDIESNQKIWLGQKKSRSSFNGNAPLFSRLMQTAKLLPFFALLCLSLGCGGYKMGEIHSSLEAGKP